MNLSKFTLETYKQLFRYKGGGLAINAELLSKGSLSLGNPIVINSGSIWQSLISKEKEQLCLQKGLEIFSSENLYEEYSSGFREYIDRINAGPVKKYSTVPDYLDKEEWLDNLQELARFSYFYGQTEFSFHDLAYEEMVRTGDQILKKNLTDLGLLKIEGRKLLNSLIYMDGVWRNILTRISMDFLANPDGAYYLFSDEVTSLFEGNVFSDEFLQNRRSRYGLGVIDGEMVKFSDSEVRSLADVFLNFENVSELKGRVAQKGYAKGKVIVVPMINNKEAIFDLYNQMEEGDILVAQSTTPDLMNFCTKASAIVTDQGGMLSHAAIVSRELNIPCIVGTEIATEILKNRDMVEVDADKGIVKILS